MKTRETPNIKILPKQKVMQKHVLTKDYLKGGYILNTRKKGILKFFKALQEKGGAFHNDKRNLLEIS